MTFTHEYFSDGISEEILNTLTAVKGLKVTARTSSFSFKDKGFDIPTIGRRLNVMKVLEGSVRKIDNRVRITVQLVSALDGYHIWSSVYDRQLEDIFSIQEDISRAVAQRLAVAQVQGGIDSTANSRESSSFEAYELYLLGRYHWHQRSSESISSSIEFFKRAIQKNPNFVLSYTGLADAYNLLTAYGNLSGPQAAELMRAPVERAIELDDTLSEVRTSYGAMRENMGDLVAAERAYKRAVQLNSNYALAHMWLGNVLNNQSRLNEAQEAYQKSFDLDPLNAIVNINLAKVEMFRGQFDEGLKLFIRARDMRPDSAQVYARMGYWFREYGRLEEALRYAEKAVELDPRGAQNLVNLANAHMDLGNLEEVERWIEQAIQLTPENWQILWLKAEYLFLKGDYAGLDSYIRERLSVLTDGLSASRDLKVAYMWAGLAKLLQNDRVQAISYFDRAYSDDMEYRFEANLEIMFMGFQALANSAQPEANNDKKLVEQALEYANQARAQGWALPDFLARIGALYAIQGNPDQAVKMLSEAIEKGYRKYLVLQHDPSWESLRDNRQFREMLITMKNEVDQIRARVSTLRKSRGI